MVSLRRRRLLGLCAGVVQMQNSNVDPFTISFDDGNANASHNGGTDDMITSSNRANAHPKFLHDLNLPPLEVDEPFLDSCPPKVIDCTQLEDETKQPSFCASTSSKDPPQEEEVVKRRKLYRRRNSEDYVPMRGVYLKNSKWQAAIKVDKKQIHLGTLNSQAEAVHIYDRAAYMCGREPNFELSPEEKQQLRNLKWDDFLAMTRGAITTKGIKRRHVYSVQCSGDEVTEANFTSEEAELNQPSS